MVVMIHSHQISKVSRFEVSAVAAAATTFRHVIINFSSVRHPKMTLFSRMSRSLGAAAYLFRTSTSHERECGGLDDTY